MKRKATFFKKTIGRRMKDKLELWKCGKCDLLFNTRANHVISPCCKSRKVYFIRETGIDFRKKNLWQSNMK